MKNGILIGVLVVAAALAAWRFSSSKPDEVYPDTDDSRTTWICERCDEVFHPTAKELQTWRETRMRPIDPKVSKQPVFRCDKCGDYTIVRAALSKNGGVYFPDVHSDGTYGVDPAEKDGGG